MKKDDIEAQRGESFMLAAVWLGGLANVKMLAAMREALELPGLNKTHLDLFAYIDPDGTTISEIARRKGVSKQAISKLVQDLQEMGFLETRENPDDFRSKLVSFNLHADSAMRRGFGVLHTIDRELCEQIGKSRYEALLQGMQCVIQALEKEDPSWSISGRSALR